MRTAAIAGALFAAIAAASDVHDLKKDTFEAFIQENDLVLAECMFDLQSPPLVYALLTQSAQSLHHGADTARRLRPSMRRLRRR